MTGLEGKKIILSVTGSIAAYKSAFLVRLLVKAGAEVQVLMTDSAKAFISPLTFSTLSKKAVFSEIFDMGQWNNHVELGLWADLMLFAPATANTIAKCAMGQTDNLVVATYLSAKCPVMFAPAMDLDMWRHPSNQNNLETLKSYGNHIIPVEHGELASGLTGEGRMAEPENILNTVREFFSENLPLKGKKALVTAGPTREPIDPVRFLGNPSTGKMGIAIADSLAARGADVTLVLGPTSIRPDRAMKVIEVGTAEEMYRATIGEFSGTDVTVLAAAVADYTPEEYSPVKVKKTEGPTSLKLKRTKDIAGELSRIKKDGQIIVGFALETDNAEVNAKEKLQKKNFHFIVLNSLEDEGAGFAHETNKVRFLFPDNSSKSFELKSKAGVAEDIVTAVLELMEA